VNSKSLAEAGFIYNLLTEDAAVCMYCDCSLEGWEPTDDPLHEHKRYGSNYCYFLDILQRKSLSKNTSISELKNDIRNLNEILQETAEEITTASVLAEIDTTTSISKTKTNRMARERGASGSSDSSILTHGQKSGANKSTKSSEYDPNDDYWNKLPDEDLFDDLVKVAKSPKQSTRQPSTELNLERAAKSKFNLVKEKPLSENETPKGTQNTSKSYADFKDMLDLSTSPKENVKAKNSGNKAVERGSSEPPGIERESSKQRGESSKVDDVNHEEDNSTNESKTESGTKEDSNTKSKTTRSKIKSKKNRVLDQLRYSPTFWASNDEPISARRKASGQNKETKVKEETPEDLSSFNDDTKTNVGDNSTNNDNTKRRIRSRSKQKPEKEPKNVELPADSIPKTRGRGRKRGLKTDLKTTSDIIEDVSIKTESEDEPETKKNKVDVNNSQQLDYSDSNTEINIPKTRRGRKLRNQTISIEKSEDKLSKNGTENNEASKDAQEDETEQQPQESVTEEEQPRITRRSKRIAKISESTIHELSNEEVIEQDFNTDSNSKESKRNTSKKRKTASKSTTDQDPISESQTKRNKRIKLIKSIQSVTPTPPSYDISQHDIDDYDEKNIDVLEETINVMAELETYKPSDVDHSDKNEKPSVSPIRIKKPTRQNPGKLLKMGLQRNDPKKTQYFRHVVRR
jgi:hypothetical protein